MQKELIDSYISSKEISKNNKIALSVQFNLNGFSFCVIDIDEQIVNIAQSFKCPIFSISENINQLFISLKELEFNKNSFVEISISFFTKKIVLIPDELYNTTIKDEALNFAFLNIENNTNFSEHLEGYSVYLLYSIESEFINSLSQSFIPEPLLYSSTSKLIDTIYKDYTLCDLSKTIFLNFYISDFEIIVLDHKQISFYNNFKFSSPEDVLYYLAIASKEFNYNLSSSELVLFGEINENNPVFNYLNNFVETISFSNNNAEPLFLSIPLNLRHKFYNLLHF